MFLQYVILLLLGLPCLITARVGSVGKSYITYANDKPKEYTRFIYRITPTPPYTDYGKVTFSGYYSSLSDAKYYANSFSVNLLRKGDYYVADFHLTVVKDSYFYFRVDMQQSCGCNAYYFEGYTYTGEISPFCEIYPSEGDLDCSDVFESDKSTTITAVAVTVPLVLVAVLALVIGLVVTKKKKGVWCICSNSDVQQSTSGHPNISPVPPVPFMPPPYPVVYDPPAHSVYHNPAFIPTNLQQRPLPEPPEAPPSYKDSTERNTHNIYVQNNQMITSAQEPVVSASVHKTVAVKHSKGRAPLPTPAQLPVSQHVIGGSAGLDCMPQEAPQAMSGTVLPSTERVTSSAINSATTQPGTGSSDNPSNVYADTKLEDYSEEDYF